MKSKHMNFIFIFSKGETFLIKYENDSLICLDASVPWFKYLKPSDNALSLLKQIGLGDAHAIRCKCDTLNSIKLIPYLPHHSITRQCLFRVELMRVIFKLTDEEAADCMGVHVSHFKNIKYGGLGSIDENVINHYQHNVVKSKKSSWIKRALYKVLYELSYLVYS